MRPANIQRLLVIIALLGAPLSSWSLSSDRDQPINIEADRLDIDDSQHISIYQGNVDMRQGSLHIRADKIIFHFNAENDLQRLEIEGSPATLDQLNDNNEEISGSAKNIIYTDNQLLLKLSGDAKFRSVLDTIEGEWIDINTGTDALKAGSKKGESRVRMLIQPKNSTAKPVQ